MHLHLCSYPNHFRLDIGYKCSCRKKTNGKVTRTKLNDFTCINVRPKITPYLLIVVSVFIRKRVVAMCLNIAQHSCQSEIASGKQTSTDSTYYVEIILAIFSKLDPRGICERLLKRAW